MITGSSPLSVLWHKDNKVVSSGASYRTSSDKNKYILEVVKLEPSDQGIYLCKASNSVGTAMCSTEIKVIKKPSFVKPFEAVATAVGTPLHLECQVDEDTGVTITWTRDGKRIHQSTDCKLSFEDKIVSLDISKTKLKDSGKYDCTAANDAGSTTCSSSVIVQGKTRQLIFTPCSI